MVVLFTCPEAILTRIFVIASYGAIVLLMVTKSGLELPQQQAFIITIFKVVWRDFLITPEHPSPAPIQAI